MRLRYLFAPALLLLLAAPSAYAAPSAVCQQVKTLEPVSSHYVKKVLERADEGLTYIRTATDNPDFDRYRPTWTRNIASGWSELIDSTITLQYEEQELTRVTACLQFDQLLLECKMDEVREELHAQLDRGSVGAIRKLLPLLSFLQERKRQLQLGALDPLYSDPSWGGKYDFDSPNEVWCCPLGVPGNTCAETTEETCSLNSGMSFKTLNECNAYGCVAPDSTPPPADDVLCPYDADYAPPFQSGFGCDIETMQPRSAYAPLQAELEALSIISQQVKKYQSGALAFVEVQQRIDELFGNESTTPEPPPEREHLVAYGCGWTGGYCGDDEERRCQQDSDCEEYITCNRPEKVCKSNRLIRCNRDDQCPSGDTCEEEKELPASREVRGPFSFKKDQISILSEFLASRVAQDVSREFRDDLKSPNEFEKNEQTERDLREFEDKNPIFWITRLGLRMNIQGQGREPARREALIYPEAVDAPLEIAESLKDLREAVSKLSTLASKKDGVRRFVSRYAYFIRRTCIYRPCNLMLEQVIRIVTADECFPYTNGEYLSDSAGDSRREKCKTGAGI